MTPEEPKPLTAAELAGPHEATTDEEGYVYCVTCSKWPAMKSGWPCWKSRAVLTIQQAIEAERDGIFKLLRARGIAFLEVCDAIRSRSSEPAKSGEKE